MPRSSVAYEISPECIFYARGRHRDAEESLVAKAIRPPYMPHMDAWCTMDMDIV